MVCLLGAASSQAATVNFIQNAVNDATGATLIAVSSNQFLESGATYPTVTAPATSGSNRFTQWTNSSEPATSYRDAWGRSLNPIQVHLLQPTTATARYLPTTRNTDGDGIQDWFEIEYFGDLSRSASDDADGDGILLSMEFSGGTHPLFANSQHAGGVSWVDSGLITVNLAGYPKYTLRSVPAGTVNQTAFAPPGTMITSPTPAANASFGYWTLDGLRQQDAWGVAVPQISFTLETEDREAVAYLFSGDSDGDTVPDAYEHYYYDSLDQGQTSDSDGDGIFLPAERSSGSNPLYGNLIQAGGVAWADSAMVTVNLAGFSRYTLSSVPAGIVNQSAVVTAGTVITTPNLNQPTFGDWELDGVRQQDDWGVALRQISFTVNNTDRTAVATLLANDSDGDSLNDGFERYFYGTLANDADFDGDGDGIPLLAELAAGTSPIFGNSHQRGGVSWADSAIVVANLQPYERLSKILLGSTLTDFFSPDPGVVTGIQAGTWSATAVTDWDGDGDLDLFVAHEGGLRVFRNTGTARNPKLSEIIGSFDGLATLVAAIDRPAIAGGDWNGDRLGDLVIGGDTGTLRLIASGGTFTSDGGGTDFLVGGSSVRPSLGDVNGDGLADLLVLLEDGTVRLYPNNGSPFHFADPGTENFLGVHAPEGTSIATGDINQDGLTDVLLADADGRIWEFLQNGNGSFLLKSKVWGGSHEGFANGLTLAAVDWEGDGDLDLIGGLANGGVIALRDPGVGRPTGLVAVSGASSIQLDWNADWQSRIRGYFIYTAASPAGPWSKLLPDFVPLPSHLDTTAPPAVLTHYQVSGVSRFFLPGNSEPRSIESLPSESASASSGKLSLALRPSVGRPGEKVRLKLMIENAAGASGNGLQLRVSYDPAKLLPLAQAMPGGVTVITSGLSQNIVFTENGVTANGELLTSGSGGSLEPGSGTLFTLQFQVATGLPPGTPLGISLDQATLFDLTSNSLNVEILPQDPPESGAAFIDGDLNGDGLVLTTDKTVLENLTKPDSPPPTTDELMAGDLNGDGKLDLKDLVLLMQLLNSL